MWDRPSLASTVSSQSASRTASPLPRRTSSARGPYITSAQRSARGSSVSLVSNDSSTSLLTHVRRPNGSSLKQSTTIESDDGGAEAVEKLQRLLGHPPGAKAQSVATVTEDDLEMDFDFGGLTLRQLARADIKSENGRIEKPRSPLDYVREKAKFEDLHKSIRACDDVLSSVESNLTSFRNDLALVSADIENLQARSTALNVRLENRKAVEKGLGPIVEDLSVSPVVVGKISEGHIDEQWVQALKEVDKRATAYKKGAGPSQGKAAADLGPLLEKLTLKAIERIRDFLVAQIKAIRSPQINAQIIQQQNFLKFKDLFAFLHKHHETLADEICLAYMNTMRWYYLTHFTRYEKALAKIKLHILDKNDVLGHEDLSRKASSKIAGPPHDAFNLGRRIELLKTSNQSALSSYLAEEDQSYHYLEVPFRNLNLALIDNATAEYTFLASFFAPALSLATIARHFNYIFEPTFTLGRNKTRALVADTYDTLGLLLSIRLTQHLAFELQRRRVPAVDAYINATTMLLWPRLQLVMDHHCESVRALTSAATPLRAATAAQQSAAPHVATQRFGQLLHSLLTLSAEAGDDEPVVASLRRLRAEMEAFLTKYSQTGFGKDRRKRERFLYNNYSLILTIISDAPGKLAAEQQAHFEGLKTAFQEGA